MDVTRGATPVVGSDGSLAVPLSAAERMRRSRARRRAEIEQRRIEEARRPLHLVMAAEAEREIALIEAQLDDAARGLPVAERTFEGAKAVILRLYGHPLLKLAETANAPPELLARRLSCTALEAARLSLDAQRELLDRLVGKPAPAKGQAEAPAIAVQLNVTPGVAAALNLVPDQGLGEGATGCL